VANIGPASILEEVRVPSLLTWGVEDNVLHVANATVFQKALRDCTVVVLDETGHVPMVERPELTAEHIRRFIGGVGAAGPDLTHACPSWVPSCAPV
jgi:pimeloyl-ACP methyl ester carboxylesterase